MRNALLAGAIVGERKISGSSALLILLANVLQSILHRVLLIAEANIYRCCSTIDFIKDYFSQQYQK